MVAKGEPKPVQQNVQFDHTLHVVILAPEFVIDEGENGKEVVFMDGAWAILSIQIPPGLYAVAVAISQQFTGDIRGYASTSTCLREVLCLLQEYDGAVVEFSL